MKKLTLHYLLLFLICFSCKQTEMHPVLTQAENLMETKPDSALLLLESIKHLEKMSNLDYATWCLLVTQARDKNYVEHTSDSVIQIAVTYFENKKNRKRLAQSYYCHGRILQDLEQIDRALVTYQAALTYGQQVKEYKLCDIICRRIGNIFRVQNMKEKALPYYRHSYLFAKQGSDSVGSTLALWDIGCVYAEMNPAQVDSSMFYYKQAYTLACKLKDVSLESAILNTIGREYSQINDFPSALKYMREAINLTPQKETQLYPKYLNIGDLFLQMGCYDSAYYYLNKSLTGPRTKAGSYFYLSRLNATIGQYKEAYAYKDSFLICKDSIDAHTHSAELTKIEKLYNTEKSILQVRAAELKKQIILVVAGGIIIILLLIVIGYYQRRQYRRIQILRQKEKEISRLSALIQTNEEEKRKFANQIELLKLNNNDLRVQNMDFVAHRDEYENNKRKIVEGQFCIEHLSKLLKQAELDKNELLLQNSQLSEVSSKFAENNQKIAQSLNTIHNLSKQIEQLKEENLKMQASNIALTSIKRKYEESRLQVEEMQRQIDKVRNEFENIDQILTSMDTTDNKIERWQSIYLMQSEIYRNIKSYIRKSRRDKRTENMYFTEIQWQEFLEAIDKAYFYFLARLQREFKIENNELIIAALIKLEINSAHIQIILNLNTPSLVTRRKNRLADKLHLHLAELDNFISAF